MPKAIANLPEKIASIIAAALNAVEPRRATRAALFACDDFVVQPELRHVAPPIERLIVLGAGKAALPMAQAVEEHFPDLAASRRIEGVVVTKYGHGTTAGDPDPLHFVRVVEAGHPLPDAAGIAAGEEILRLAESATERDLVVAVISGGGSALLEALAPTITLADWQETNALLLASGAEITEVNTLRKRLSRLKGGQLARAIYPTRLITLALSDVIGSPLDAIASGPTVPDTSTWADAWRVVEKYHLQKTLPAAVLARLASGLRGELPETPRHNDRVFARTLVKIVADNAVATNAAALAAKAAGYHAQVITNALTGEAADVAVQLVDFARAHQRRGLAGDPEASIPTCLIWGGETTVTLGEHFGEGGRNQEMAIAAAIALDGAQGIDFVALATDGTDGPTDAAGGYVTGATATRARKLDIDLADALRTHNGYPALKALNVLLITGPTRTNVNDIAFAFIDSPASR